ncbi:MAG TPA: S1 family peptidase, partial [Polyangiaceae bacterium]|nr:S1 family peptidase [Polyangiaceae bacterium]
MRSAQLLSLLSLTLLPVACGAEDPLPPPESTGQHTEPIIGGTLDSDSSHDGVVMLYTQDGALCTGSVISQPGQKGVVLTARHCVSNVVSEYVTCKNDVSGDLYPGSIYVLKGTSPNENSIIGRGEKLFHTGGTSLCDNDIAVMVLQDSLSGVQPLRVRKDKQTFIGETFTAIGYGLTNPNSQYSAGKRYLRSNVQVTDFGPKYYGLYEKEFLGTVSICQGDSGGPAVSSDYAVMGVTSRGGDCNGNTNIWTRPEKFIDVIDQAVTYAGS